MPLALSNLDPLKLAAPLLGLAAGALIWLILGGSRPPSALDELQTRGRALSSQLAVRPPAGATLSDPNAPGRVALSRPLLAIQPAGPMTEGALALQGVSLGPARRAALIAVGSNPAVWLGVGESRYGATLTRLDAGSATLETLTGERVLTLGAPHAAAPPAAPSPIAPNPYAAGAR